MNRSMNEKEVHYAAEVSLNCVAYALIFMAKPFVMNHLAVIGNLDNAMFITNCVLTYLSQLMCNFC